LQDGWCELLDNSHDSAFGTSFLRRFEFVYRSVNVFVGNRDGLVGLTARQFDAIRTFHDALCEWRQLLVRHRKASVSKNESQQLGHQGCVCPPLTHRPV
jgi:hypothetical protein